MSRPRVSASTMAVNPDPPEIGERDKGLDAADAENNKVAASATPSPRARGPRGTRERTRVHEPPTAGTDRVAQGLDAAQGEPAPEVVLDEQELANLGRLLRLAMRFDQTPAELAEALRVMLTAYDRAKLVVEK